MFILGEGRDDDVVAAFRNYRRYLASVRDRFPPNAFALAISDWWFDPADHDCPHDAWLEEATIRESSRGARQEIRGTDLHLTLLGAYHDVRLHLHYAGVTALELNGSDLLTGHGDWRYDEFRVSDDGMLIHEIEWANYRSEARWIITAGDVFYRSEPVTL